MGLVRYAWAHLRGGWRRGVIVVAALVLAVASSVVLTSATRVQRLQVTQTLTQNYRNAYDIVVRPPSSVTPIEASSGLVRSSFLAGTYGGITLAQADRIASLPGVQVSAPVAMVGVTYQRLAMTIDVTHWIPTGQHRVLLRFTSEVSARNDSQHVPWVNGYVYLTRSTLLSDRPRSTGRWKRSTGRSLTRVWDATPVPDMRGRWRRRCYSKTPATP